MKNKHIKDHPPWYARGTPVTNTRDGPAMAINDNSFPAIRRKPSARGEGGEGKGKGRGEEKGEGEEKGLGRQEKDRRWLTLKTTYFNMPKQRVQPLVCDVGNHHLLTVSSAGE